MVRRFFYNAVIDEFAVLIGTQNEWIYFTLIKTGLN